jgi:hypothetical protein
MTRDYEIYRRIVQSVEQGQNHAAGVPEHRIDTLFNKRIDDNLCAGFDGGLGIGGLGIHLSILS